MNSLAVLRRALFIQQRTVENILAFGHFSNNQVDSYGSRGLKHIGCHFAMIQDFGYNLMAGKTYPQFFYLIGGWHKFAIFIASGALYLAHSRRPGTEGLYSNKLGGLSYG